MNLLDFLLQYKDLIDMFSDFILMIFTFFLGFKGLDTINKYHTKKKVDLEYQREFDLIKQTNHQLQEFISGISMTQSLFKIFNNKYNNFEGHLDTDEFEILKDRFDQLENSYIKLDQIIFKSYLLDSELIEKGRLYRFAISEYLHKYSKVFEYLEENHVVPSEIDLNDEYFKELTIFYDDTSNVIFDLFSQIEEITSDLSN